MVGIHELTLFYDSADPELKLEVDMMLENGHIEKAWETIINFLKKVGKLTVLTEGHFPVVVGFITMDGQIKSKETTQTHRDLNFVRGQCWRYNPSTKIVYWHGDESEHDEVDEINVADSLYKKYGYTVDDNITLAGMGYTDNIDRFRKYSDDAHGIRENSEYRGNHSAPDRKDDPVYNLTTTYPDIYTSPEAYRFYGYGTDEMMDRLAVSIYRHIKDKPNLKIRIYRAVPLVLTSQEKLEDFEKQKKYILKTGKIPKYVKFFTDKSKYYDYLCKEEEKIKKKMTIDEPEIKINPGDWVTPIREYAVTHGKTEFDRYKILSKVVPVKDLYTDGNSIFEWGYDPS